MLDVQDHVAVVVLGVHFQEQLSQQFLVSLQVIDGDFAEHRLKQQEADSVQQLLFQVELFDLRADLELGDFLQSTSAAELLVEFLHAGEKVFQLLGFEFDILCREFLGFRLFDHHLGLENLLWDEVVGIFFFELSNIVRGILHDVTC